MQDIVMLEASGAGMVNLALFALFLWTYHQRSELTYARYLAVIFFGATCNYVLYVAALVASEGACRDLPFYSMRAIGLGSLCACAAYGGLKLLLLGRVEK